MGQVIGVILGRKMCVLNCIPVLVVAGEDGVDHVDELLVLEDLGLRNLLPAAVVVVRLVCMGITDGLQNNSVRLLVCGLVKFQCAVA